MQRRKHKPKARSLRRKVTGHRNHRKEETYSREDEYNESGLDVYTKDTEDNTNDATFFEREKGPKNTWISSFKTSKILFDRLMNYRYYHLNKTRYTKESRSAGEFCTFLKRLEIYLEEYKFYSKDVIIVLDFLTRFVENFDTLGITEAKAYLELTIFLTSTASQQYCASRNESGSRAGGINS